ncbi:hypothetical protein L7F22_020347 [Adiantum nelumboides]|nr:hypothetical protein [Adiantum nelumboides]
MSFPTFNGAAGEDAQEFLDSLEIACLVTGRDDDATRVLFLAKFGGDGETSESLWGKVCELRQGSLFEYNVYELQFVELWERWVASLRLGKAAPDFLKKDRFVAGLCPPLREKVKGRFPVTWMDARDIARLKERKIRYQLQQREADQEEEGMAPVSSTNAPAAHRGQGYLKLLQDTGVRITSIIMRADTQLDYATFQLTPTRTRCELLIVAKGLTYKLASGLLKPFVSHLRAAEEQLAKGGYSIRLEPPDPSRASWFTKGTMERFVRFVSTPEVLERVSSVEVELFELEETTRQQTSDTNEGIGAGQADSTSFKTSLSQLFPGGKSIGTAGLDKGPKGLSDSVENVSEESSKQRLLRALDARRMMLQKEQGMAFARALAAGFNLENMDDLVLFAECFGANRLREACVKFMALCKKRQESGLGLVDLELMAAENVHADMLYMGAIGGNTMGLVWPHPQGNGHELSHSPSASNDGKEAASEENTERRPEELTRRGSLDEGAKEQWQTGPPLRSASGDGDSLPAVVKGHPMMAAWQAQPHNQYMTGVPPYAAMHPGMPNHYDPSFGFTGPARPGLSYPPYIGNPYIPTPYPDGNGWQPHSPLPPQYWPGSQASDPTDGGYHRSPHQQSMSTPSSREKDAHESNKHDDDDMHDDGDDYSNELSMDSSRRPPRRSASPRRRSASPLRRVQIGRTGGSKRSGMVVIRNINYIAPKAKQQDVSSENSDSSSEGDDSEDEESLKSGAETLRASIEDAVGVIEGKNRGIKDGKRKHLKKDKKNAASKDSLHLRDTTSVGNDDAELDGMESKKDASEHKEYVWVINRPNNGADELSNVLSEEGLFSGDGGRMQDSFDPSFESVSAEKKDRVDSKVNHLAEDVVLLSQLNGSSRATESLSLDMFEQEQYQESKKLPVMDDSYIIAGVGSAAMPRSSAIMEPDFDLNAKVVDNPQMDKTLPDDSFIVLDRSAARDDSNVEWRMPLNLEAQMPIEQNFDGGESASEAGGFEPEDLFMVPDRGQDTYKRAWNSPLDYDMEVLAADMMDIGRPVEDKEVEEDVDEIDMQEQQVEEKPTAPVPRKISEKDAKAKAMKEMLERRKSAGGVRPGRPNPLAEAQLRAEKLRLYKAGLQKSKKEKEDEERKRIEDLKIQRQQRIAARSNPGSGSPTSPSQVRGPRTPATAVSKFSPKVANKASSSPLSPSVNREKTPNGSRMAHNALDSPKHAESTVTRSVSSLTELHREAKKPSSAVRASTGSHLSSLSATNERNAELNAHTKQNGQAEDKVGRAKSGRKDDKISRVDSGLAEERVARTASGRMDEKLGRTESGRIDGHSDNGGLSEKVLPLATRTSKRAASQDGLALHLKSPKSPTIDSKVVKKTSTVPSKSALQKKTSPAPKEGVEKIKVEQATLSRSPLAPKGIVEKIKNEQTTLPLSLKEQPEVGKSESLIKVFEGKEPRPGETEIRTSNENGIGYMGDLSHASVVASSNDCSTEKVGLDNGSSIPSEPMRMAEVSKEQVSHMDSSFREASVTGSDDRLEVEVSSSVGEECHAPVAHVSPSADNRPVLREADVHTADGHLVGEYSPPFAPPSEYSVSPTVNLNLTSPTSQQELTLETSPNGTSGTRSRKKWGDSKAKGLKRLLLLGRKSGRSSASNTVDIPSDCEDEDSPSSNGKNSNIKLDNDPDNYNGQGAGLGSAQVNLGSSNASSKGSRSIFSLSTFRSNKSTVKAQ